MEVFKFYVPTCPVFADPVTYGLLVETTNFDHQQR